MARQARSARAACESVSTQQRAPVGYWRSAYVAAELVHMSHDSSMMGKRESQIVCL